MRTPLTASITLALLSISSCYALDSAWSYTMEEMYQRATAYKLAAQGKSPEEPAGQLETLLKAHEFRGYVAGILDAAQTTKHQEYQECARRLPVSTITARAASAITSVPLDRTYVANLAVLLAIVFACDEAQWSKPK